MTSWFLRALDSLQNELNAKIAEEKASGKNTDAEEHIKYLHEIEGKKKQVTEYHKEREAYIKHAHNLPKTDKAWLSAIEALDAINKTSLPEQRIEEPKAIVAISKKELEEVESKISYDSTQDVIVIVNGGKLTIEAAAHELGHKQQNLYDRIPTLAEVPNYEAFLDFSRKLDHNNEIRADLTSSRSIPSGNWENQLENIVLMDREQLLKYARKKSGNNKKLLEDIIEGTLFGYVMDGSLNFKDMDIAEKVLNQQGIDTYMKHIDYVLAHITDSDHPFPKVRGCIMDKQSKSGIKMQQLIEIEMANIETWKKQCGDIPVKIELNGDEPVISSPYVKLSSDLHLHKIRQ